MPADRIPPHDLDLEQCVLGAVLIDRSAIDSVLFLSSEDFYRSSHGTIWAAMAFLHGKGTPIDIPTLSNHLESFGLLEGVGGRAFIMELTTVVSTAANVVSYAKGLRRLTKARQALSGCLNVAELIYGNRDDLDKVMEEAVKTLQKVSGSGMEKRPEAVSEAIPSHEDTLYEKRPEGMKSGFASLDRFYQGFGKTDLVVLAARPGVGKSSAALNIACSLCSRGKRVLFLSLEMEKGQVYDRLVSSVSNVSASSLGNGSIEPGSIMHRNVTEAVAKIASWKMMIDDSPKLSVDEVKAKIRYARSVLGGLDMCVIDYLGLMRNQSRDERVGIDEIMNTLKEQAKDLECCIMVLAQLNRDVEKDKPAIPKLAHLRGSGSIEAGADAVMFLYRPEKDPHIKPEELSVWDRRKAKVILAKNRHGQTGTAEMGYDGTTFTFFSSDRATK